MAFNLLQLIVLFFVGCNAGVVPQHFISNHTEPVNVDIEKPPTNFRKNESNSSLRTFKTEILSTAVGDGDHHNSSEVSIIGFHNTSEELNLTELNISEKSHPIVINHSKEFDHSHKGDIKGSSRSRKKSSKGSNRSKKTTSKETKHVEKVTKGHFKTDSLKELHHSEDFTRELSRPVKKVTDGHSLNDSHNSEDFTREVSLPAEKFTHGQSLNDSHLLKYFTKELSHPVKDSNMSDHAENLTKDHLKVSLNDLTEDFLKGFNHFEKNVSEVTDHVVNITNVDSNKKGLNESDHADEIVIDFNHFNLINESHHQDVLNNSRFDVAKEFLDFDNVTKPVHQVEQNESKHFENVAETVNDTIMGFDTIKDFQMTDHFGSNSGILDETAENLSNSYKISDDHIDLKEQQVDNISDINHHNPSMKSFHDDNIHKIEMETHSENPASEMDSHNQHESFNSSEVILNDPVRLSAEMDSHFLSNKENSLLGPAWLHKDSEINSTLSNQFNETNDTPVKFTVSPIDHTNSSTDLSHEFRDLEINTNDSRLNPETNDHVATEENATQSLFSGIGLGFLFNSELAKNAASAMEVFNFTDSAITDHIMDDKNDVHDFLDIMHPPVESDQSDSKENIHENVNATEIDPELNSTSGVTTTLHPQTLLHSTVDEETITVLSSMLLNSTVDFEETTMVSQPLLNSTVEFEETTTIVSNSTVSEAICPPPGICIFWFLAQDTCAVNSHCLGSRICCRIGCAKTCIEV